MSYGRTPTREEAAHAHVTLMEERIRIEKEKEKLLNKDGRKWDVQNNRKKNVWERDPVPMKKKEDWIAR